MWGFWDPALPTQVFDVWLLGAVGAEGSQGSPILRPWSVAPHPLLYGSECEHQCACMRVGGVSERACMYMCVHAVCKVLWLPCGVSGIS